MLAGPIWIYTVTSVGAETVTLRDIISGEYSFLDRDFAVYDGREDMTCVGLPGIAPSGSEPVVVDLYRYSDGTNTWTVLIRVNRDLD